MLIGGWRLAVAIWCNVLVVVALGVAVPTAGADEVNFNFKSAFGPDGSSLTEFASARSVAIDQEEGWVYVLDGDANALYKFDLEGDPVPFGGASPDVFGNELSGLAIGGSLGGRQVAVDSNSHIIYLTGNEEGGGATALQAFLPNGDEKNFTSGPGKDTNEIGGFFSIRGVAVDSSGNIYVSGVAGSSGTTNHINVYSASGALLLEGITASGPNNLAVDGNGTLYVLENFTEVVRLIPSEFPITSATTYTPGGRVDPRPAISAAVDPLTDQLYVTSQGSEGEPVQARVFSQEGELEGTFGGAGEGGELHSADGIAIGSVMESGISGPIARPFVANNPIGGPTQVEIFQEIVVVDEPSIEATSVTGITGDSATLRAKINPNNRDTTYWFEYGTEDCGSESEPCLRIPLLGASIGDGRKGVSVSQAITGLDSNTLYHYRVVAENEIGTVEGLDKTFFTQDLGLGFALSDSRAWEMVSPSEKFGGTLITAAGTIIQASTAGDHLVYASRGSLIEHPQSSRLPEPTTMLAAREDGGRWSSRDLAPPQTEASRITPDTAYKIFTPELDLATLEATDNTPLSPEASERTPYLWSDGVPPLFTPLVNPSNVPAGTKFGPRGETVGNPIRIQGVSPGLDDVIIGSDEAVLVDDAVPQATYRWSGGELEAVSELPESEGGLISTGILGSGEGSVRHAVSADGSRVFWSIGNYTLNINTTALYLRDTVAEESTRLDAVKSGLGPGEAAPVFNLASADGSLVYFTDSQQLTEDASASGRDLYRCEIGIVGESLGCAELTDISAPIEGSGESAEVLDQVPGFSEDGTRLYFVARGVLDAEPNEEGDLAEAGEPNLYFWQEGEAPRFVSKLSDEDESVWGSVAGSPGYAGRISAMASPDGRFFAFTSERSLTGYENQNVSGQLNTEVFLYDAEADENQLTCVSCNPTGAAAVGEQIPANVKFLPQDPGRFWVNNWVSAALPEASQTEGTSFGQGGGRSLYRPRSVLNSGRVFFNSVDPLVPVDSNGNWDVYQYEPVGVGSCAADTSTAAVSRSGNGCLGLLSSGTSDGDAGFLDASPDGNDVFFLTKGRLSVLDTDDEFDAYDARVNGIKAVLEPKQECAGEACQPVVGAPNDPTPASESFNAPEKIKCRKGQKKVKRKGRTVCVHKKHKKHKKHGKHGKKRAGNNRGAQR